MAKAAPVIDGVDDVDHPSAGRHAARHCRGEKMWR